MRRLEKPRARRIDRRLRTEIHRLGEILGRVLRDQEGDSLFRKVEKLRRLTKAGRNAGGRDQSARIRSLVNRLSAREARSIVRAFHIYFLLANAADEAFRIRSRSTALRPARRPGDAPLARAVETLRSCGTRRQEAPHGALRGDRAAFDGGVQIAHPWSRVLGLFS